MPRPACLAANILATCPRHNCQQTHGQCAAPRLARFSPDSYAILGSGDFWPGLAHVGFSNGARGVVLAISPAHF